MAEKVYTGSRGAGKGSVNVPSFTKRGVHYVVNTERGYCSCPHHHHTGAYCKHLAALDTAKMLKSGDPDSIYRVEKFSGGNPYSKPMYRVVEVATGYVEGRFFDPGDAYALKRELLESLSGPEAA